MDTVKSYADFKKAYDNGKSYGNKNLVLYVRKNGLDHSRLGITVSKKTGNAVIRNKIKRRMKEIYRECENDLKPGYDYVFIIRRSVPNISFDELRGSFYHIVKIAKIRK